MNEIRPEYFWPRGSRKWVNLGSITEDQLRRGWFDGPLHLDPNDGRDQPLALDLSRLELPEVTT